MLAFHGTTRENAKRILSGQCKNDATWNCSDDDYLYLWCPKVFVKEGECDKTDAKNVVLRYAFESAQITAAMSENMQHELIVMCFDFPNNLIEIDDSCEHMELSRKIDGNNIDFSKHLKTKYIAKHNPRLDAFVISGLLENHYANIHKLDDDLLAAAELVKDKWFDELLEFDWKEDNSEII